jgi:hypothetical protein
MLQDDDDFVLLSAFVILSSLGEDVNDYLSASKTARFYGLIGRRNSGSAVVDFGEISLSRPGGYL